MEHLQLIGRFFWLNWNYFYCKVLWDNNCYELASYKLTESNSWNISPYASQCHVSSSQSTKRLLTFSRNQICWDQTQNNLESSFCLSRKKKRCVLLSLALCFLPSQSRTLMFFLQSRAAGGDQNEWWADICQPDCRRIKLNRSQTSKHFVCAALMFPWSIKSKHRPANSAQLFVLLY